MTNIWADPYKEIRKPFFDTESLEEERAKKDYDEDGKIESGAKEHAGAVHNAIQKKRGGKPDGQDTSSVKEEVAGEEQLNEISDRKVQGLLRKRGAQDKDSGGISAGYMANRRAQQAAARRNVRTGSNVKVDPILSKEEYVDEAQVANRDPDKYEREQNKKYAPVRGERTPMPPRGNKKREDFERWYHANVREEVEEVGEEMKPLPRTKMFRKAGNLGRDIVSPATGEKDRPKKYDRSKKIISQLNKEEAETITEVDSCSTPKKVDVMKGGKKNKVTINPPIKEEVEAWIGELVEEGYDISEFTMDEMIEIYESVSLEEQMPARGDAETVNATDSAQLSAKRRMAQAQIRADLARVQYQKAAMTKESVDSIVEYLSQRADAFENLEEGVFDPKKSKLRSASERSQRTMTDAQRKAAKKESERVAAIHSKGETVLAGMRPQGKKGKVKTTPDAKPAAPAANRTVRGRYDKLAAAANKVLKSTQKDK